MPQPVEIRDLWRGQSTRAPWDRLPGQVEAATNVTLDVANGAYKRNPTVLVQGLTGSTEPGQPSFDADGTYEWFSINGALVAIGVQSDDTTKVIHAWDPDGNAIEVVDLVGNGTYGTGFDYLPTSPIGLRATSFFNTLIVTNPQVDLLLVDASTVQESIAYIETGDTSQVPPVVTPPSLIDDPENTLADAINAAPGTYNNGDVIIVNFDQDGNPAGRYVKLDTPTPFPLYNDDASRIFNASDYIYPEHQGWYRLPFYRTFGRPDPDTFPHRLIYDVPNNRMLWTKINWWERLSGNQGSNPPLSISLFTDACNDVRFYQRRLFLLGAQGIVGSREGQFFNFWIDTVNSPTDADPVDLDITIDDAGDGVYLSEAGERLLICTKKAQIDFGSGPDPMSPTTGRFRLLSRFQTRAVRPGIGPDSVTIMDDRLNVHRYTYANIDDGLRYTGHLNLHDLVRWHGRNPRYMHVLDRALYVNDYDESDTLVHNEFILGDEVIQSAWSSFTFAGTLEFAYDWEDRHRFIIKETGAIYLATHIPQETGPPEFFVFWPRMDRLEPVSLGSITYDASVDQTTFTHTGRDGDLDLSRVVLREDDEMHKVLTPVEINGSGGVVVRGKYDDLTREPYIGFVYPASLTLTKLYAGMTPRVPACESMYVFHHRSTDYDVFVDRPDGERKQSPWQSDTLGVTGHGTPILASRASEHVAIGDLRDVSLTLYQFSPGQVIWTGLLYYVDATGVRA